MDKSLLALAFAAGSVAAVNPCGFAMLPAYLTLVVRGEHTRQFTAIGRAVAATAAMTLGFLAVFGLFGVLTVSVASAVQRYLPYVTVLVGLVLVALGLWLAAGRDLLVLLPLMRSAKWAPTARLGSMVGYGVGYAMASLSCTIGPFLAVTGATFRGTPLLGAVAVYLAYAAGFLLVVGVLAIAVALASSALVERVRRILPYVNRIGGAVVLLVGLYVAYYGLYEIRLFTGDGNPIDPVIGAAGRLQGTLAEWVHWGGGWPWVISLVALVLGASAWSWRRRARRRRHLRSPRP